MTARLPDTPARLAYRFSPLISAGQQSRYRYVLDYVLAERLGLADVEVCVDPEHYLLRHRGQALRLPNLFLSQAAPIWGQARSMDLAPQHGVPPLDYPFSAPAATLDAREGGSGSRRQMTADVFGSIFFVLTRYDEWVLPARDALARFPATESFLYKAGLLERPVVDEWIDDLASFIPADWPRARAGRGSGGVRISCDVDWPFAKEQISLPRALLQAAAALGRSPGRAPGMLGRWARARILGYQQDEFRETLDWIMDTNERVGNRVTFYFIPRATSVRYDNHLRFDTAPVQDLLRQIHSRGHELGVHPGFATATSGKAFRQSVDAFRRHLDRAGISLDSIGGRQHYLRWDARHTAYYYERNGLAHDSTLGFAQAPGFRCGTSHEHRLFDLERNRMLDLVERPLVVMESALLASSGRGERAHATLAALKHRCLRHKGRFGLLWHNTELGDERMRELYRFAISPDA